MHGRGYVWQGACVAGVCVWQEACMMVVGGGGCVAKETATAADGTHPTGMHSYCQ